MRRVLLVAGAVATAVVGLVITPASASDSSTQSGATVDRAPIEVRLGTQPVRLTGIGMVPLAVRVRCSPGVQAFELDASVSSGSAFGSVTRLAPPAIVTCDGRWNRATIKVAAESGTFTVGRAAYEVSVFGYSPPPDEGDSGASAGGTLWIGPTRVR